MTCDAAIILQALQTRAAETQDRDELGRVVVDALADALPQASWTGIYWMQGRELVLGPYLGPATEHTRIPLGRGVCGAAAAEGEDRVVADVRDVENYLACAADVRSEMVVLIRARDRIVGQIDLDAPAVAAFDRDDHCLVRAVADAFGGLVGAASADDAPPGRDDG